MSALHPAIAARIGKLRLRGELSEEQARAHACTLVATAHGAEGAPDHIELFLLVGSEGAVHDARYRTAAQGELLAAYDAMAELCLDRPLADIASITPRQVDLKLGGTAQAPVLRLGQDADTPYYVLTKAASRPQAAGVAKHGADELPWSSVGLFEKVRRIEGVLDQHVRAALASDGGGIDLVDLKDDELFVQYHGACGSCSSSIGGTLQFIQDSLNNHLGTALTVRVSSADAEGPSLV